MEQCKGITPVPWIEGTWSLGGRRNGGSEGLSDAGNVMHCLAGNIATHTPYEGVCYVAKT